MPQYRDTRRVMLVRVSERLLLELFSPLGQCVALRLVHPKLPEDAKVIGIRHDWDRQCFCAAVESATFPEAEPGNLTPIFDEDGPLAQYEARYIIGERVVPWKPMEVAVADARLLEEYARLTVPPGEIQNRLYISPELKAKLEACDKIVDHVPSN